MEGTQKWLEKIKKPEVTLIQSQQTHYYYLQELIVSQKRMTKDEKLFK